MIASYEYATPETVKDLSISKVEYTDDALYMHVSGSDAKKITECDCFDKDCRPIDCGWDLSASRSRIVIKGNLASKISGVTLYFNSRVEKYKVRYLDSEQPAMLYGEEVLDIGTRYTGDEERFKSDGERAYEKKRKQEKEEACEKAYSFLEGKWSCNKSTSSMYIFVYDDGGVHKLKIGDNEYVFDNFKDAFIKDDGCIQITLSGDGWNELFDILLLDIENDCVIHNEDTYCRVKDEAAWDTDLFGFDPEVLYYYDSNQYTDFNDTESRECSLRTTVGYKFEENKFVEKYIPDGKLVGEYSHPLAKALIFENGDETDFVFFTSQSEDSQYPKSAQLYKVKTNNMQPEAIIKFADESDGEMTFYALDGSKYIDQNYLINPYQDKYELTDTLDDNGKLIKQEYLSDIDEYGTYDSSGTIFYDENEEPFYKYYYVTSGSRFTFYLRDNGKIRWICDIGGMAYSAMEGNDDTEVGMLYKVYRY